MFWREKNQTQTITPNSMSPIPKNKFLNFARIVRDSPNKVDEIKDFDLYGKSIKQKLAQEHYYDYYNH